MLQGPKIEPILAFFLEKKFSFRIVLYQIFVNKTANNTEIAISVALDEKQKFKKNITSSYQNVLKPKSINGSQHKI